MLPNRYTKIERLDGILGCVHELETNVFPGIDQSDNFQHIRDTIQAMRDEAQAEFPDINEYGGETPEYAMALADFLGLGTHSDIHSVQRRDVIQVVRTLAAYGRDTGHLMRMDYEDTENSEGVYMEDVHRWIDDWIDDTAHAANADNEPGAIDLDWCTEHSADIVPDDYEHFEIL